MENTTWPDDGPQHAPVARPFAVAALISIGSIAVVVAMSLLRAAMRGAILLPLLAFGSCAATFAKGPFAVPVDSDPQGAIVSYRGADVGRTPCTVSMVTKSTKLVLRLDGHHDQEVEVRTYGNGGLVFLGILLWGPFELLADAMGDAWFSIRTNPFKVPMTTLDEPKPAAWTPPKPPLPPRENPVWSGR